MLLMMGCRCWRVDGALWMDICRREGDFKGLEEGRPATLNSGQKRETS